MAIAAGGAERSSPILYAIKKEMSLILSSTLVLDLGLDCVILNVSPLLQFLSLLQSDP